MEKLNRRRASFIFQSPEGSINAHQDFSKSPQPSNKTNHSRQNSLRVTVQHRRASIIYISPEDMLEVANGQSRSRSGSFRSSSNENLLLVIHLFTICSDSFGFKLRKVLSIYRHISWSANVSIC